jgi:alkylation response protein AidB-like acyl-CoA dehydrogenase
MREGTHARALEDVAAIRLATRKVAEREIPRFQTPDFAGKFPRQLFTKLAEVGLTGIAIEEQFDGIEASSQMTAAVMEELARVDLGPAIFISVHAMVSGIIQKHASVAQKQRFLKRLAHGELLGAFALTESEAGSDAKAIRTTATRTADGYLLSGSKVYITSAGFADLYVTFARLDGEMVAFILPHDLPGISYGTPEKKMGCELSPIATVQFDAVNVPREYLLGEEKGGYKIALAGLSRGRVSIAACANGLSIGATEIARKHLLEREQFGQALMEFQGLQFMLADMRIQLEAARALTEQAARMIDSGSSTEEIRLHSSIAKCFATDAAMRITTDAVQLLGGAGYLRDYQVERYMRDAKMLQIVEGTNQIQRVLIARAMAKE